jgi:hypothetical protein
MAVEIPAGAEVPRLELRLVKLAWGGSEAQAEAQLIVNAALDAASTLVAWGSPGSVIARYREHVAANTTRLSAPVDGRF